MVFPQVKSKARFLLRSETHGQLKVWSLMTILTERYDQTNIMTSIIVILHMYC